MQGLDAQTQTGRPHLAGVKEEAALAGAADGATERAGEHCVNELAGIVQQDYGSGWVPRSPAHRHNALVLHLLVIIRSHNLHRSATIG